MAKKGLCEIIAILDKSGSMAPVANDVIGGWNGFLESQTGQLYESLVTLVLFDHTYELVHNGVALSDVPPLTAETYRPSGMTALYDAVGRTIADVQARIDKTPEDERPERVMLVVYTDGCENTSTDYTRTRIVELVEQQKSKHAWEFVFLGAGIDAMAESHRIGFGRGQAMRTPHTSDGIVAGFAGVQQTYTSYAATGQVNIPSSWEVSQKPSRTSR